MKERIIFEEKQSFIGTWSWYLVIGISAAILIGRLVPATLAENPSDEAYIATLISIVILGSVIAFLSTIRLYVSIGESQIYYRFPPFISKQKSLGKNEIQEMEVRKYRPIWEYGGYGYRYRFRSGRALNVTGNMGLQLILKNGKKVLFGTQKPESMRTAIKRLKDNWEMNG